MAKKLPRQLVREFCRKQGICLRCFSRWAIRGGTRCEECVKFRSEQQKRRYARDIANGVCVRCHKAPAQKTNLRCRKCQREHAERKAKARESKAAKGI